MSMQEAWTVPFGLLQDMIAIYQIKNGWAERVLSQEEEVDDLFRLFAYK